MSSRQRRSREKRRKGAERPARRRVLAGAGLGLGAAVAVGPSADAAVNTLTVGTSADTGTTANCTSSTNTDCSLRDAITAADDGDTTDQDHIVFKSSLSGSTITLGSDLPFADEPLYVEGLGAGNLTVNGNSHKVFTINPAGPAELKVAKITLSGAAGLDGPAINAFDGDANGSTGGPSVAVNSAVLTGNSSSGRGGAISATGGSVLIQNSTISNNVAFANYEGGGGIYARLVTGESLTVQNSTIDGNHTTAASAKGGGVRAYFTTLNVQGSTISGNYTAGTFAPGGGVYAQGFDGGGITATIQDSTIADNDSYAPGGGLGSYYTDLTVEDSTISGNTTSGDFGFGGGLYAFGGTTTLRGATLVDNGTAGTYAEGAGITVFRGDDTAIERSTISGNHADGEQASGGGVDSAAGPAPGALSISNSTIAENVASDYGGGIRSDNDDVAPVLTNTIVAGNAAGIGGSDISRQADAPFLAAFSLIENPSGASITATVTGSNILGVDPLLQPLALNGSLNGTETHALSLSPTSPAIDCGSSGGTTTDQRGLTRPVDLAGRTNSTATGADGADIGAFELQAPASVSGACTNNPPPPPPSGGGTTTPPPTSVPKKKKCKKKKQKSATQIAKKKCKRKK